MCSSGRNTLTSPALGFNVPMNATTSNGQNADSPAKPNPVNAISSPAARSSRPSGRRCPQRPTASVISAEPSRVAELSTPTCQTSKPSASR